MNPIPTWTHLGEKTSRGWKESGKSGQWPQQTGPSAVSYGVSADPTGTWDCSKMGVILSLKPGGACGDVCCGVGSKEASRKRSPSGTTAAVQARVGFPLNQAEGTRMTPEFVWMKKKRKWSATKTEESQGRLCREARAQFSFTLEVPNAVGTNKASA